ncbi:hypothetical protein ACWIFB_06555 [Dietzia sp. NPDC055340]
MSNARPSDSGPHEHPETGKPGPAGAPGEPQTPDHAGTERVSESETMEQSPTPQPGKTGAYVWIVVVVVVVLLLVIGLIGYAFEVF